MSGAAAIIDHADAAMANFPKVEGGTKVSPEKPDAYTGDLKEADTSDSDTEVLHGPNGEIYPTKEEVATLRRVCGKIPWPIYTIGFIEMCERFAYYGTTAVFVNFIQQPLPEGSTTGSAGTNGQAGALDFGQRASTGLVLFNNFWSYIMPLLGGYLADTYWGRFKTIYWAIAVATFGHIILVISAIPQVIENPDGALGCFVVGLIFFGIGVGWFKVNISPLVAGKMAISRKKFMLTLNRAV
jgi:proton-dependent oligopeptide transporter, POT family